MVQTLTALSQSHTQYKEPAIRLYSAFLKNRFGERVHKISIDAGFTCPNRDGRTGSGGCIYCDNSVFSPSYRNRSRSLTVTEQLSEAIPKLRSRYSAKKFIAYFQPFTNTYAPVESLERIYTEALVHPDVVGISVGTRPDCVNAEILELLGNLSRRGYISVEYGCESVYDKTLEWIRRGHTFSQFADAVRVTAAYPVEIGVHLIAGFPTESLCEVIESAGVLSELPVHRIKLHHLHIVENTHLASIYRDKPFPVFDEDNYARFAADFLERLSPDIMVERLCGESPPEKTIAPKWRLKNADIIRLTQTELRKRNTRQGFLFRQQKEKP